METFLFTSESVNEGHPDKLCDQISDAVLDACLEQDPDSKVACETCTKTNMVMVFGEITTKATVDYEKIVRDTCRSIGFISDDVGLDADKCKVLVNIEQQSPDIAQGVHGHFTKRPEDIGAGDQGHMFGYATDETPELMPLSHVLATKIGAKLTEVRKNGTCRWLRPDGKTQVTVEYYKDNGAMVPVRVHTVLISTQHDETVTNEEIARDLKEHVIKPIIPEKYLDDKTIFHLNPSGRFVIGGPHGDAGLTGRKIIIDTYGGWGAHGGGAFSGKDPTKVDRSGAYIVRQAAKSVVANGMARRALVQVSYAIGVPEPLSVFVDTYGTGLIPDKEILKIVKESFDFRPGMMTINLDLKRGGNGRFLKTAAYGHFGRDDPDFTWEVDEKQKTVLLTEQGYEDAEEILDVKDLYDPREQWASYLLNAIKAKELFLRDVNYIIRTKEVLIVDEFTGRVMQGRRWSDGLHQAVEAKEGLPIQNESITLASISYQNFFLQFPKLCGMTGTASTESAEFESIYKLKTTIVPTNKPMIRKDESDVVFKAVNGKWRAVVVEISRMHKTGRAVLVGTTSVEQSDELSQLLQEAGITHEVLNAKPENVEREAEIVAQSGRFGAVTIATNMAGRGTDIILGGNAEFMARLKLREILMPRVVKPTDGVFVSVKKAPPKRTWKVNEKLFPCKLSNEKEKLAEEAVQSAVEAWGQKSLTELEAEERLSYSCEKGPVQDEVIGKLRNAFLEIAKEYKGFTDEERKKVVEAGGLHVVGTERHESRRIDNQLRGRSGRQGDPGSSRFFLSLEDNIFRIFGGDRIQGMMRAFRVEDLPIESKMLTKALDEAQRKVENYFFDIRKQLFEFDEVLNSQRDRVYTERRRALVSDSLEPLIIEYAELTMDDILEANIGPDTPKESWDLEKLIAKVQQYCYLLNDLTPDLLKSQGSSYEGLQDYLRARGRDAYLQKREIVEKEAPGLMKDAERFLILSNIDRLWKEHLQALKFVQQAVGLRGYAQRDPLIEYKLEGYNLFLEMMAQIRRNVIYSIYQFQPVMVKKDQDKKSQNGKPSKQVDKPNQVGVADEPSSVASA
ncbi:hypothetical protein F2Q68_00002477 [Brassica cretica]|uniref:S-adenosylmethionine synthase n=1 Tax=Brassica cretica TaxID=69181 RepID=A0A8S9JLA4_BRACR|nr:hypothetical protein F2Q68_00002477 [Brassica cretica]